MATNVTAMLVEGLVTHSPSTRVSAMQAEVLVGPFGTGTRLYGMLIEGLVAPAAPAVIFPFTSVSLGIENNVTPTNKYVPLTGLYSTEETITGWLWDRRRLENERLSYTQYETYLGGHEVGLLDGTKLEHWESGTVRGCGYKDLTHYRSLEFLTWTPRVEVGSYAFYHNVRPLYSDYSYSTPMSTNAIENGAMWHDLRSDALHSTVHVSMYSRDSKSRIFNRLEFERVEDFTGVLESNERVATTSGDTILWDKLETRKPEFLIQNNRVWLNDDWSIVVGDLGDIPLVSVEGSAFPDFFEAAGSGIGTGRDIFLKIFPVQTGTVKVYSKDAADNVTEWTEQANLNFSHSTDKHFSVDYDLGIVTMGGFQAPDLVLAVELDADDTEVTVYLDDETMDQYPHQGIIVVGTEEIAYYSRSRDTFYNLLRGYNNTTAQTHAVGSLVHDIQHGSGTDEELYVGYVAVPRIEYEVTEHNLRSANKSPWLDVRPSVNVETNNIVQMLSSDINLAEVVLETDSTLIGGELYGPVFFGTDVSNLTARGVDSLGNPVEDIPLSIEILSGAGFLNGRSLTHTGISNSLGEIYAYYNSPYSREHIEKSVSAVNVVGADTQMTVNNLPEDVSADEVWVFQVLKHDKTVGTVGAHVTIVSAAASTGDAALLSPGYIETNALIDEETFKDGYLVVVGTDGISYTREIVYVSTEIDGSSQPYSRIHMNNTLNTGVVAGQTARLFEPEAVEWNPSALNGVRVILYEWRDDVLHPITGELGAYYPLQPDSISGQTLIFEGRNLPLPDLNDATNNLGAYVVVAPGEVSLQAYGRDPISGRVVKSNIIKLQLRLPVSLSGVDSSGVLPIPYGFTFATEEFNVGSGIGGSNFLTINPAASGINQFSLLGIFP